MELYVYEMKLFFPEPEILPLLYLPLYLIHLETYAPFLVLFLSQKLITNTVLDQAKSA